MALDARRDPATSTGAIRRIADPARCGEPTKSSAPPPRFRRGGARPQDQVADQARARDVPVAVVVDDIDTYRDYIVEGRQLGVEPIRTVLRKLACRSRGPGGTEG
jgi:hypothetical protein